MRLTRTIPVRGVVRLRSSFLIGFLLFSGVLLAQENVLFFTNPYLFNPSYAGVEGRPAFFLNYQRQWINVDGSPQVGSLSFHTPVKKFISMGAIINNDKRGLFNTTSLLLSGSYTVMLGDYKSIRFGISAGGGTSTLDLEDITDDTDPALLNAGNTFIQGSAGVSFHLKSFHGGIALPSIFEPSYVSGNSSGLNPLQTVIVHASNRFYWNKNKHMVEPTLVYRYRNTLPSQLEAALVYHMNGIVWLGGSFKQHFGSSAFAGVHLNKVFGLGYAYTFKTQSGSALNSPSHEIQLTLLLGKKKKEIPFYSFVDPEKEKKVVHHKYTPASQAIAQNRNTKPPVKPATPPVKQESKPAVEQFKKTEPVVVAKTEEKPPVVQEEKKTEEPKPEEPKSFVNLAEPKEGPHQQRFNVPMNQQKVDVQKLGEMPHVHDTLHPAHADEKERIARLALHADNPTEHHGDDPNAHPHAERHELVKRGNHADELDYGDYVVAGVFRSKVNAKHFADGLVMHGFKADHGHLTLKNLWYVYIAKTSNLDAAKAERDKYRKMTIFRDCWLLTVHD